MSEHEQWIADQKKNKMFRGGGRGNDADRMLEYGHINKISNKDQQTKIIAARILNKSLKIKVLGEIADMVEKAQMVIDGQARGDFSKVAIQQWQGKVAASKNKISEAIQ